MAERRLTGPLEYGRFAAFGPIDSAGRRDNHGCFLGLDLQLADGERRRFRLDRAAADQLAADLLVLTLKQGSDLPMHRAATGGTYGAWRREIGCFGAIVDRLTLGLYGRLIRLSRSRARRRLP